MPAAQSCTSTSTTLSSTSPPGLRLLARLAALQDRLRKDISAEREVLRQERPSLDGYPPTSTIRTQLADLTGTAGDPDLAELARLDDDGQRRLAELRAAVTAAEASTAAADAAAARKDAAGAIALLHALRGLTDVAGPDAATRLRAAATAQLSVNEAVRLAAEQLTGPVAGIGTHPWELLWQAARNFVAATDGAFPPTVGSHCPLCLQGVDETTAERLAHFEDHVTSSLQATAAAATIELENALAVCSDQHAKAISDNATLAALRLGHPEIAARVDEVVDQFADHLTGMCADPPHATAAAVDLEPVTTALREWAADRSSRADALEAADDAARLPALRAEMSELAGRERLAGVSAHRGGPNETGHRLHS